MSLVAVLLDVPLDVVGSIPGHSMYALRGG